ncbi:MAG: tcyP [Gammaproteobacteria bacterium]|jgi:L-cystine uptake protein TcyP (sodium:dicarboxylate symporter family)|nr:tcyP [Gammaproteobacteria bacterium]
MLNLLQNWPILVFPALLLLLFSLEKKPRFSNNLRIFISLILGILSGMLLNYFHSHLTPFSNQFIGQSLTLVSDGYMELLRMLVLPLILTSIIHAFIHLGDHPGEIIGKLLSRSVGLLLLLTAVASALGMAVGLWLHVGQQLSLPSDGPIPAHHYTGLVDTLLGMIPSNPIAAMSNDNTVAIAIFACLLGISALQIYKKERQHAENFKDFITSTFHMVKQLARLVIRTTPYGVLALLAKISSTQGFHTLIGIAHYLIAIHIAVILVFILQIILIALFARLSPWAYLKKAYPTLLVAFTTRSSFGCLPLSEETLHDRFKVSQLTASFVPSMGATLGMSACAGVFPAMLVVMALAVTHQPMTVSIFLMVMFINTIASLGISGIPGTAFVAATVTLTAMGLPYAVVGLVQGVDSIVDMSRTATNVNGTLATAIIVDRGLVPANVPTPSL